MPLEMGCYSFFFSSRRRHTRCSRDWSSDVCSSDLARVDDQFMANGAAGASDEVKHSRRQLSVAQHFVEANAGEGSVAGRFENDGVAGDQRAGGHARGQCEWKVEWRDHGPDAVGVQHAAGLLGTGAAHGQLVTVVFLHLLTVVEDEVDSLGYFGDGFKTVLADFEAEERGKFKLTPRH